MRRISPALAGRSLALYLLSSIPVDRPEPSEALQATAVWSTGLDPDFHLLCARQLDVFRQGGSVQSETDIRGERGAFFAGAQKLIAPGEKHTWRIVAALEQGPKEIAALRRMLESGEDSGRRLEEDQREMTRRLVRLVASADGLQAPRDQMGYARHFTNTLFNIMRGGVFRDNYRIDGEDFRRFAASCNGPVREACRDLLESMQDLNVSWFTETDISIADDPKLLDLLYKSLNRFRVVQFVVKCSADPAAFLVQAGFRKC